jgi:hypothetical protein
MWLAKGFCPIKTFGLQVSWARYKIQNPILLTKSTRFEQCNWRRIQAWRSTRIIPEALLTWALHLMLKHWKNHYIGIGSCCGACIFFVPSHIEKTAFCHGFLETTMLLLRRSQSPKVVIHTPQRINLKLATSKLSFLPPIILTYHSPCIFYCFALDQLIT